MKYITTSIIVSIVCISNAFATAQTPDYVIYEGKKYALFTNPLDSYFEEHSDKKPEMTSTANWRGYIATFEITNSTLVLKKIETEVYNNDTYSTVSIKEKVFGSTDNQPIEWFTGILVLPQGEIENYVHMGYGSTYSNYTLLEIKNGKLGKVRNLNSTQYAIFREKQYAAFKKTTKYRDVIDEIEDYKPYKDDGFIRSYFAGTYTAMLFDECKDDVSTASHYEICYFQQKVLPALLFQSDGVVFADLKNGSESKIIDIAKDVVDDDFAKSLVIQPVPNKEAYTITFRKPAEPPECFYVLIIKEGEEYLYYTLEKRTDLSGKGNSNVLCQLTKGGAHQSFGTREYDDLKNFIDDVPGDFAYTTNPDGITATIIKYTGTGGGTAAIPSSLEGMPVTTIMDYAFSGCTNLTRIIIPDSVTSIGDSTFDYCISLVSVTIPDSVTTIGRRAFDDCTNLTSVIIPDSVTSIGQFAFCGCTRLTSVTIPEGVPSIGELAFYRCANLTSVTIPASITNIEYRALSSSGMISIMVDTNNSAYSSVNGVLLNQSQTTLIQYPDGRTGSYTIPDSVTTIKKSAFNECAGLTSITIPDSVTIIEDYAFESCTSLTNITFSNSITNIGYSAFSKCTGLTSIIIPNSVTSIGNYAFGSCTNLSNVTIPDSVTSIGDYAFDDCTSLTRFPGHSRSE